MNNLNRIEKRDDFGAVEFSTVSRSAVSGKLPPLWSSSVLAGVLRAPFVSKLLPESNPTRLPFPLGCERIHERIHGRILSDGLWNWSCRSRAGDPPQLPRHRALPYPTQSNGPVYHFSYLDSLHRIDAPELERNDWMQIILQEEEYDSFRQPAPSRQLQYTGTMPSFPVQVSEYQ